MTASVARWEAELDEYEAKLGALDATLQVVVGARSRLLPSYADYQRAWRAAGELADDEPLAEYPALVAATQAHWHAEGHNACTFARHMSRERFGTGWETYVITGAQNGRAAAEVVYEVLAPRLIAPEAEVVSVIVPSLADMSDLAEAARRLGELPGWLLHEEADCEDAELGTVARLGLRVGIELDFSSEVLGFGPCAANAITRRAPFVELAVRAKPPRRLVRERRAFMAQVEIPGLEPAAHGQWWAETVHARRALLGDEHDARGKAKVTLAIPTSTWRQS